MATKSRSKPSRIEPQTVGSFVRRVSAPWLPGDALAGEIASQTGARGVGKGSVSLLSMAAAWVRRLGPARLYVTTWSNTGLALPMTILPWAQANRRDLHSIRVAMRPATATLQPAAFAEMQREFPGAMVVAESHAEVVVCVGDGWARAYFATDGVYASGRFGVFAVEERPEPVAALVRWFESLPAFGAVEVPPARPQLSLLELAEVLNA